MKKLAIKYIFIVLFIIILILVLLFYANKTFISTELNKLIFPIFNFLVKPLFKIGNTPISILKIIISILIFSAGFMAGKFYKKNIKKIKYKYHSINRSTLTILSNVGYYLIIIFAFFIGLNILGINLSSIALIAGALSVGIGFGLQNIVSNFVSGIILMFEQTIKIGDYIELSDGIKGHVKDIRMRSITITTNSNIDIIIPNQYFIQNHIINWTMEDMIRRFEIPFGVAYGTDPEKVITVIEEAIKKSNFPDVLDTTDKKTRVVMTEFGDSSINFELFVWIKGPEILYPKRTKSRFLILIYKTLNENNIEIPFPQRDLHVRSIDEDIIKKLNINEN